LVAGRTFDFGKCFLPGVEVCDGGRAVGETERFNDELIESLMVENDWDAVDGLHVFSGDDGSGRYVREKRDFLAEHCRERAIASAE
jgi:hypothetical protein